MPVQVAPVQVAPAQVAPVTRVIHEETARTDIVSREPVAKSELKLQPAKTEYLPKEEVWTPQSIIRSRQEAEARREAASEARYKAFISNFESQCFERRMEKRVSAVPTISKLLSDRQLKVQNYMWLSRVHPYYTSGVLQNLSIEKLYDVKEAMLELQARIKSDSKFSKYIYCHWMIGCFVNTDGKKRGFEKLLFLKEKVSRAINNFKDHILKSVDQVIQKKEAAARQLLAEERRCKREFDKMRLKQQESHLTRP